MKIRLLNTVLSLTLGSLVLTSCSKNDDNGIKSEPSATGKYVLLTAESKVGYYGVYDKLPTGEVDNIGPQSMQGTAYGFRQYKNWLFDRSNISGETGVARYSINAATGKLESSGFIKCGTSAQNLVVDENTGFYFDAERGKTRIQKFNPTTMQRTGEIDLSSLVLKGDGISTNVSTGDQTIVAKEGKLYVNIDYYPEGSKKNSSNTRNYTLAVIDIATEKLEKTIVHPFVKNQGFTSGEPTGWTQAADGSIYFNTYGWDYDEKGVMNAQSSGIFRIKAGETDFDKNWYLKPEDLGMPAGAFIYSLKIYKGKLFVDVTQDKIVLPSFANIMTNIFRFYVVDLQSKASKQITDIPLATFGHSVTNIDIAGDDLFFHVVNNKEKTNGLYKLNADGVSASPAFSILRGGEIRGIARLFSN